MVMDGGWVEGERRWKAGVVDGWINDWWVDRRIIEKLN